METYEIELSCENCANYWKQTVEKGKFFRQHHDDVKGLFSFFTTEKEIQEIENRKEDIMVSITKEFYEKRIICKKCDCSRYICNTYQDKYK